MSEVHKLDRDVWGDIRVKIDDDKVGLSDGIGSYIRLSPEEVEWLNQVVEEYYETG